MSERLWEVDVVRTIAILMMVAYHIGYDANLVGPGVDIDPLSGGWLALQVATGSSFLFIVGVSLCDLERARPGARALRMGPLPAATPGGPPRCCRARCW